MENNMRFENLNAFPLCRNRPERVACLGEAMIRNGEGCTASDLKNSIGITQAQLDDLGDDARAYAMARSVCQGRASHLTQRAA
jgi:hypothetical protein